MTPLAAISNSVALTPPLSLCDHLSSHTRPKTTYIADLAAKGHLLQGNNDTILLVQKPVTAASASDGHNSRRSRPLFDDPVRIYVPLLARPWILYACDADASCHLGVTRTLKMLKRFYWWVGMEACTKNLNGGYDTASSVRYEILFAKLFAGLHSPSPCPTAPEYPSALTILGPCQSQFEEYLPSSSPRTASAGGRICSLSPPRNSQLKVPPTSW